MQAESRLQLEQAQPRAPRARRQALEQRRERLDSELQTLAEPDARRARARPEAPSSTRRWSELPRGASRALQAESAAARESARRPPKRSSAAAARACRRAQAQLATLRQIQADAENNAPLRDWLERHGLGGLPRLWQKLRIDPGWETAVEAVLRERLHALELSDAARLAGASADRRRRRRASSTAAARPRRRPRRLEPLAAKIHATDAGGVRRAARLAGRGLRR